MHPVEAYQKLKTHCLETAYLESTAALLHWDQRICIPPAGHGHRAEQVAILSRMIHARCRDPLVGETLAVVEGSDLIEDPLCPEAVNTREWRRAYDRAVKIPDRLAEDMARATSNAESCWERARPENDWDAFKPHLETILALKKEEAEAVGYEAEPYDALLDTFEPGATTASLEPVFARLREAATTLLDRLKGSPRWEKEEQLLSRLDDTSAQEDLAADLIRCLGFEESRGRLDVSAHPFTSSMGPDDVRITARYGPDKFGDALYGAAHEAGHALYEMGLSGQHWGSPMGEAVSLGIHESQSRMWENMVCRSPGFWRFFMARTRLRFPTALKTISPEEMYVAVNRVRPGLIRIESDELTYNLHILLRFELELALLRGDLAVEDLPTAWNEKMCDYLGITPPDVAQGVMQDVHWSAGLIGYFPTYTLGNLYAAQFFQVARKEIGDVDEQFGRGDFQPLLGWLRRNIHGRGMQLRSKDLVVEVTGEALDPEKLIRYLETKYTALYGV